MKRDLNNAIAVSGTEIGSAATRHHAIIWPPGIVFPNRPSSAHKLQLDGMNLALRAGAGIAVSLEVVDEAGLVEGENDTA